jgi:hypothetical protein
MEILGGADVAVDAHNAVQLLPVVGFRAGGAPGR